MGEEEKKPEEKKEEEAKKPEEEKKEKKEEEKKEEKEEKKEEKPAAESKEGKEEGKEEAPPPPPPEEFVYKVFMHCEGCARKVKRSLRRFPGVEDVIPDCKAHKVVVKGKTADPLKVLDRIQRKSHRKVELLTPLPKPPAEDPKKAEEEKEKPKQEEKKEEVIVATMKVHMHCEACAQAIKRRIQRMKGVQSADPDLKSSQVVVKGVFDPTTLVEYVYKRTGKHAVIVKQEPEKKGAEEKGKEEKKEGEEKGEGEKKDGGEEKKDGGEETKTDVKKYEFFYYTDYPRYTVDQVYAPQIFSDENPNACSVM